MTNVLPPWTRQACILPISTSITCARARESRCPPCTTSSRHPVLQSTPPVPSSANPCVRSVFLSPLRANLPSFQPDGSKKNSFLSVSFQVSLPSPSVPLPPSPHVTAPHAQQSIPMPFHPSSEASCSPCTGILQSDAFRTREKRGIYICSSRLGLIKMDHRHSGNGRNSQQ
jgi:hypothetical protein